MGDRDCDGDCERVLDPGTLGEPVLVLVSDGDGVDVPDADELEEAVSSGSESVPPWQATREVHRNHVNAIIFLQD